MSPAILRISLLGAALGAGDNSVQRVAQAQAWPQCYRLQVGPWSGPFIAHSLREPPPTAIALDTGTARSPFHRGMWAYAIAPSPPLETGFWLSWWRSGPDSIHVAESNGEYGVAFTFTASGDTLRGVAQFYTDLIGPKQPSAPLLAVRIPCPSPPGSKR